MMRRTLYPLVSVDVALFCVDDDELQVLLIQRANEPLMHQWALPGGLLQPERDASLEAAAMRVLGEKIDLDVPHLAQVSSFSGPRRDPRGWSVAALHYALLPRDKLQAVKRNKVEQLAWVSAHAPSHQLAFDHGEQIAAAVSLLRARVENGDLPLHLMAQEFTLTQLQHTCEAILNRPLDKSVFRRQLRDARDLVATGKMTEGGRQRPAHLYCAVEGFSWR